MQAIIKICPPCPRCNSIRTGEIKPQTVFLHSERIRDLKRNIKKRKFIRYVSPNQYASYYLPMKINMFCSDCEYEFRGSIDEHEFTYEEYIYYCEEMGFLDMDKNLFVDKTPQFITNIVNKVINIRKDANVKNKNKN